MNDYKYFLPRNERAKKIEAFKKILDPNYTKGGRLFADCMIAGTAIFEEVEDVTDWSKKELYEWLGY